MGGTNLKRAHPNRNLNSIQFGGDGQIEGTKKVVLSYPMSDSVSFNDPCIRNLTE